MSSYRNKTLLNYQDLELIYGNAICNGNCSHLQEGNNLRLTSCSYNSMIAYYILNCSVNVKSGTNIGINSGLYLDLNLCHLLEIGILGSAFLIAWLKLDFDIFKPMKILDMLLFSETENCFL